MNSLTSDLSALCQSQLEAIARKGYGLWAQQFHLMPQAGWLNDPNGLCQKDGIYHAYFQNSPFNVEGGLKCWAHATSQDLVSWDPDGVVLLPDTPFDCHGAYSGSALVHEDRIYAFYTGNVKEEQAGSTFDYVTQGRQSNLVLAASEDGTHFGPKRLLMTQKDYPAHVTQHVRDPRILKNPEKGGPQFLMLLGARAQGDTRDEDYGEALVYGSDNLEHWHLLNEIVPPVPQGYMWECPDLLVLGASPATRTADADPSCAPVSLLSINPQGLLGPEAGSNIYPSGYVSFTGSLLGSYELGSFILWDGGFDFYAPQTFVAQDGRHILIGWMGMPDCPEHVNPTAKDGWQHCFTLPREVVTDGHQVFQRPVADLLGYRTHHRRAQGRLEVSEVPCFDLEITGICRSQCKLTLAQDLEVFFDAKSQEIVLRFGDTSPDSVGGGRGERRLAACELASLRVVGDASSVEVFCNGGAQVFSTRYYPHSYSLAVQAPGAQVDLWELARS